MFDKTRLQLDNLITTNMIFSQCKLRIKCKFIHMNEFHGVGIQDTCMLYSII
jgi:hypothetical protein